MLRRDEMDREAVGRERSSLQSRTNPIEAKIGFNFYWFELEEQLFSER